jgi:hypothetical protein
MSQQFCIKKTPEECEKDMKETTQKEIAKLAQQIRENPSLLKRNKYNYESDSDDVSISSESYSTSTKSTTTKSSRSHHKRKINKNALELCKKEIFIDKLEEKNYFKTLEMNNLILENNQLQELNKEYFTKIKELDLYFKIITEIIELNKLDFLKIKDLTESNINNKILQVQKDFDKYQTQISKLTTDLNLLPDSPIKNHYNQELVRINLCHISNFEFNNKFIERYISDMKKQERCNLIWMFIMFSIILIFIKDYAGKIVLESILNNI